MEYAIIETETASALAKEVNDAIAEGWKPIGGIAITAQRYEWENDRKGYKEVDTYDAYAQAMVRESPSGREVDG